MKVHTLKCWPAPFNAVADGIKCFEFRINDRDYHVGDILDLREWEPCSQKYTGRSVRRLVTYILIAGEFEVPHGYCIMSLRRITE